MVIIREQEDLYGMMVAKLRCDSCGNEVAVDGIEGWAHVTSVGRNTLINGRKHVYLCQRSCLVTYFRGMNDDE